MRPLPLVLSICLVAVASAGAQAATSCSQRSKACFRFCESTYRSASQSTCTTQCADALPRCMQTGCWVTRMSNTCGLTKG